ncbi:MAG TPA: radical SAM protein, partial [Firmicutes bacterium]|nr:radical SAM protein [Bacillota bacterium]
MSGVKLMASSFLLRLGIRYLLRDPEKNLPSLVRWARWTALLSRHKKLLQELDAAISDPSNHWLQLYRRACRQLHPYVREKALYNFFLNAGLVGMPRIDATRRKTGINIPWAILMDPTSACNLDCTGCWAADYEKGAQLPKETLDRIITEGKALGIYMYLYSGGEPLLRFADIEALAKKHSDCMFLAFTNATLVTEEMAARMAEAGNIVPAVSIEGFAAETDMRRGAGTFAKVVTAMETLKRHGVAFGFSACYHSRNTEAVAGEDFLDFLIEQGCLFGWYFTYMPLGKKADVSLLATTRQRELMYHTVRKFRR